MSRAFVKEDGDQHGDELPERPIPSGPNYVTPRGRILLREKVLELEAERKRLLQGEGEGRKARRQVERDLRYFETRLETAVVVEAAKGGSEVVRFGAEVEARDGRGEVHRFRIVGQDEADASGGTISWSSPLAAAVLGAKCGDEVAWERPAGKTMLKILEVGYPSG